MRQKKLHTSTPIIRRTQPSPIGTGGISANWHFKRDSATDGRVPIDVYESGPSDVAEQTNATKNVGSIQQYLDLAAAELVAKTKEAGIAMTANSSSFKGRSTKNLRVTSSATKNSESTLIPSAFIREHIAKGKSARQIIAEAEKAGLKFSRNLVYAVKSMQKSSAKQTVARDSIRRSSRTRANLGAHRATSGVGDHERDAIFRKLAVEMGLARARELLDDLEERLRKMLEGG